MRHEIWCWVSAHGLGEGGKTHPLISDITPDLLQASKGPLAQRNYLKKTRQGASEGLRLAPQKVAHQSLFTRQDSEIKVTASWQGTRQNGWSFGEPPAPISAVTQREFPGLRTLDQRI